IVSECKTRDDAEVKWKIAKVVQQTSADTGTILNHGPAKHLPQHDGDDCVEKKVSNRGRVSFCVKPASGDRSCVNIFSQLTRDRAVSQQGEWAATDDSAEEHCRQTESD